MQLFIGASLSECHTNMESHVVICAWKNDSKIWPAHTTVCLVGWFMHNNRQIIMGNPHRCLCNMTIMILFLITDTPYTVMEWFMLREINGTNLIVWIVFYCYTYMWLSSTIRLTHKWHCIHFMFSLLIKQ